MTDAPAFLASKAPPAQPEDRLQAIRAKVAELRDLEQTKADLDERLKAVNVAIYDLQHKKLPELMAEVRIKSLTIGPDGNSPGVTAKLSPYYKANIETEWPEDRRKAALDYLTAEGHGDLIKTVVAVSFNREARDAALSFLAELKQSGLSAEAKETVHHMTLTAWLKEQVERHSKVPDLDKIGGTVGSIVKVKAND